jgi:hypothetical protein
MLVITLTCHSWITGLNIFFNLKHCVVWLTKSVSIQLLNFHMQDFAPFTSELLGSDPGGTAQLVNPLYGLKGQLISWRATRLRNLGALLTTYWLYLITATKNIKYKLWLQRLDIQTNNISISISLGFQNSVKTVCRLM